ncbi:MAG: C4-dicarboxylate ABC transporter, partial [Gammaproteobacteria bacterium]
SARVDARHDGGFWQWRSSSRLSRGAIYADPVYLEAGGQPVDLNAEGDWDVNAKRANISFIDYRHAGAGEMTGSAVASIDDEIKLEKADISLHSGNLEKLSSAYLNPFFEQTALEGVSLKGQLTADIAIVQQSLTSIKLLFHGLDVKDREDRFALDQGAGLVNWSSVQPFPPPSRIDWRQLMLRALPIGPGRLGFLAGANKIALLEKVRLPFLGGTIAVNKFTWRKEGRQEPEVFFEGGVDNVSLEQLSKALNWTPLSGTVSGYIPGVDYRDKTLKMGGELNINVFDGAVKITDLTSSGLFTDFPRLTAEIEINDLDMEQLTSRFEFGSITGRLSGFIKRLTLENWKPVGFYAWLGTPDDDESRHRISQKAVKNIASIGGGGATDLLSRSFLNFFETFGYDKLGIGCYLHDGVCQLMGVEATENGYYIVKGGGLPRIDVIGFNPQVDWNVLMERLKRITASDEIIVQ